MKAKVVYATVTVLLSVGLMVAAMMWVWDNWAVPRLARLEGRLDESDKRVADAQRHLSVNSIKIDRALTDRKSDKALAQKVTKADAGLAKHGERLDKFEAALQAMKEKLSTAKVDKSDEPPPKKELLPNSVAVLPCKSIGKSADSARASGLASLLTSRLVQHGKLHVTPLTQVLSHRKPDGREEYSWAGPCEAGQVLGVQYVVAMVHFDMMDAVSAKKYDHFHVELIRVDTGAVIWSLDTKLAQDGPQEDADKVVSEAAREVAGKILGK